MLLQSNGDTRSSGDACSQPETSAREKWSWQMFDFATQPFASSSVAIFIPLILDDLAWDSGTSDPGNPAYPPCLSRSNATADQLAAAQCYA